MNENTLQNKMPNTPDGQQQRLQELKRLFPDLFDGEGQLKLDDLKQLTGEAVHNKERYDFTWSGKRNAKQAAYSPTTAALTYDETRSVNPDKADGNLIIEGENLESLKCLLAAYRGAVKCIYIDPPYNTGKDFVYSDNYNEERKAYWEQTGGVEAGIKVDTNPDSDGRYHSNWLNMIYPRLLLARQLLKDDGVIFVSIDDNEVHNLRKVMDEVFGEENFVAQLAVQLNPRGRHLDQFVAKTHESILVFGKNCNNPYTMCGVEKEGRMIEEYNRQDEKGKYRLLGLRNRNQAFNPETRSNLYYPLYVNQSNSSVSITSNGSYTDEVWPDTPDGVKTCWTWGKEKVVAENKLLIAEKSGPEWRIYRKDYLVDDSGKLATTLVKSLWTDKEISNDIGRKAVKDLFDNSVMDFPKSPELLKILLKTGNPANEIVLDFFSGSGTTAQAVLELNKQDNGNRQFILVQLPEQTKADSEAYKAGFKKISDITIERVKRVINGYGDNPQPLDAGFKVYQLTKSHFPRVDFRPDPEASEAENLQRLEAYITEKEAQLIGLFEPYEIRDEVLLKNGFRLDYRLQEQPRFTANTVSLADDGEKSALICLDNTLSNKTVEQLLEKPQAFICLERALNTDAKWNLRQHLKHLFIAF